MNSTDTVNGEAYFSPDAGQVYRYALSRAWGDGPMVMFIGLNPSTADATVNDPTIRRCMGFARREGYGGMWMANLFALRATKPARLFEATGNPMGPDNEQWLRDMAKWCGSNNIIAAWGIHGDFMGQAYRLRRLLDGYRLRCLGRTKKGHPRHPLYLRADAPLEIYAQ